MEDGNGEPHDGGLVQLAEGLLGEGQHRGQLGEDLTLLPPTVACGIARLFFPLVAVSVKKMTRVTPPA